MISKKNIFIQRANIEHIEQSAQLLIKFQEFYNITSSIKDVENFLQKQIQSEKSIIFLAYLKENLNTAIGIAHLSPIFNTLLLNKIWILNDLYVDVSSRNFGVSKMLLEESAKFAKNDGASYLELKTEHTNMLAKHIYEKFGFQPDLEHIYYSLKL